MRHLWTHYLQCMAKQKWKTSAPVRFTVSYNLTKILRFRPSPPEALVLIKNSLLPGPWVTCVSAVLKAVAESLRREEPLENTSSWLCLWGVRGQTWGGQFPLATGTMAGHVALLTRKEALLPFSDPESVFLLCPETHSAAHGYSAGFPAIPLGLFWTDSPCYTFLILPLHRAALSRVSIIVHQLSPASTDLNQRIHSHKSACLSPLNSPQPSVKSCVSCLQELLSSLILELQEVAPHIAQLTKLQYQQLRSYSLYLHHRGLAKRITSNSPGLSFIHSIQYPLYSFCSPSSFSRCSIPGQQPISLPYIP